MKTIKNTKFLAILLILVTAVVTLDFSVSYLLEEKQKSLKRSKITLKLSAIRAELENAITSNLLLIYSTASHIAVKPDINQKQFEELSKIVLEYENDLKTLVAAPDFVMTYVHPMKGNENIVGVDYRNIPHQWEQALAAKQTGKMAIAGPINLIQGGVGVIARVPVFFKNKDGEREFWGLVSSVLDFEKMMINIEKLISDSGLNIAIRGVDGKGALGDHFYGDFGLFAESTQAVKMRVMLPNGEWQMAAVPVSGWDYSSSFIKLVHFFNLVFLILSVTFLYHKMKSDIVLETNERKFRSLVNNSPVAKVLLTEDNNIILMNGKFTELFGYTISDIKSEKDWWNTAFADDEYKRRTRTEWEDYVQEIQSGRSFGNNPFEMIVTCKDGHIKDVLLHYRKIEDMGLVVFYDITERVKLEQELQRYIRVIDDNVITSQTDKDGYITYASKAFCKISGYSKEELFGKTHEVVRHPDTPGSVYEELWDTLEKNMIWRGELKNRDKSGNDYWVDTVIYPLFDVFDSKIGYMSVRNDITDKKKIEQISITDRLTGIYNRLKLDEALGVEYERFSRYESKFSVILFDIDKFKSVNDTYGHIEGDNVLKKVAEVTGKNIRATDCFGRWGGEEFLIICSETVKDDASILAEKIRKLIENTDFGIDRTITCSFGVAEISINDNAEQLVSRADKLLYKAKENGRNRVEM